MTRLHSSHYKRKGKSKPEMSLASLSHLRRRSPFTTSVSLLLPQPLHLRLFLNAFLSTTVEPLPSVAGKKSLGEIVTLRNHTSFVSFLGIHPNQKFLVSGGWDGRVNFWKSDFNDIQETLQPVFRIVLVNLSSAELRLSRN